VSAVVKPEVGSSRAVHLALELVTDLAGFKDRAKDEDKGFYKGDDLEDRSKVNGSRAKCYKRTSDEMSRDSRESIKDESF
jgi:hypothetical protein